MSWAKISNIMGPAGPVGPAGPAGPQGPPGTMVPAGYIMGETAGGTINNVNTVFSAAQAFLGNSLEVYLNGLRQRRVDDYTETSATTFTFVLAPHIGDTISIDYLLPTTGGTNIYGETPSGALNGVNKTFTTLHAYSPNMLAVYLGGLRLRKPDDYTETGSNSFQLVTAPLSGDNLSVDYLQP